MLTERLELRHFQEKDLDDLFDYAKSPLVGPNAGWPIHQSKADSQEVLHRFIQDPYEYAVVWRETGKVIGGLGLKERKNGVEVVPHQREVGYVLHPDYWGRGIIPEAVARILEYGFETLELEKIWCEHYDFNDKSKRVVEKSGFVYQFTETKTLPLLNDQEVVSLNYVITKEDYRQ
ncbi:GNAT family N-acetyltransferase [Listeria ilorinensis]|uniref:GNAT family N-acetyltransferase n=1 Tax=Listeria ilorinensis TaxID=2867439 RepID=UPI001EF71C68|nr:GNAT family N-acetyltransferase [Listeria ilorinensis]